MYKKRVSVLCVFDPLNYSIQSLQFKTSSRHKINMTHVDDIFTSHKTMQELIERIVKRAINNNYEIPFYEAFNALWYDIDFIPISKPDIVQYGYLHGEIKVDRRIKSK